MNELVKHEDFIYKLACSYMALTELHDRFLTLKRCEYDPTCANVSFVREESSIYAFYLRNRIKELYGEDVLYNVRECIKYHRNYNYQKWIDEWIRLKE